MHEDMLPLRLIDALKDDFRKHLVEQPHSSGNLAAQEREVCELLDVVERALNRLSMKVVAR